MKTALHAWLPEQVGKYRLLRELGRGSMGVVYLAERLLDFKQEVAIKLLYAQAFGEAATERVLRALDHPGIVKLLDCGRLSTGTPFLVMEFVDGLPLDVYCAEQVLSQRQRILLLLQAVEAVAYAHSRFVLHADLKPQNILVTRDGELKLLDFGITVWGRTPSDPEVAVRYSEGFSSPEQRAGGGTTVASDVYALGKIASLLLQQTHEGVDAALGAILRKATVAEPERRYGTARAFADDLQAFLSDRPVAAYGRDRLYLLERWVRRNRAVAGLLLLLLLVVLVSTTLVTLATLQAAHSRHVAQSRLEELVTMTGSLQRDLYSSLPATPEANVARQALLDHVSETLEELQVQDGRDHRLAQQLAVEYGSLARLLAQEGQLSRAQKDLATAAALARRGSSGRGLP